MVKQLQDLWLNNDDDTLEKILTNSEPEALSELSAAQKSKSKILLVVAKDGREYSILTASEAYSDWAGQYPMEFSPVSICTPKLSDPALADEKITKYQRDALKEILDAVYASEDAVEFRKPVMVCHPDIWDNYKALIAEPIDIETMQHWLYHNRYATMGGFWRHVDLLEENARTYNGDRNRSIVTAATKIRNNIYHRMDEIPAEPPLGQNSETQIRRIIYADEHDSDSATRCAIDEGANGLKAGARHTDSPTFFLPLGRLGVARKAGGEEVIATPYIVVMGVESAYKPLWIFKDNYTPVGLPSDKKSLLGFGSHYNFTIAKLVDNIKEWQPLPARGCRALKGNELPTLRWGKVRDLIRRTSQHRPVIFDVVENKQQAKAAIEKGWDRSTQSSESASDSSFVVGHDSRGDRDSDYGDSAATRPKESRRRRWRATSSEDSPSMSDYISDESEESVVVDPPRKRTRAAKRGRWSS
ncbi:hypothetical protein KVR01_001438 [Diaporthe batatas]|uniref:uncharacterized protein n=1 Tax=Diaporthe batatas TaxID=748121 RepID=UPI001D056B82|nr:uncharacterized protein KVR01_001438 [Diaporthe batatas]KAG8168689.1 hypothetical protein KVR01_001438 [Diaporthe batatas]